MLSRRTSLLLSWVQAGRGDGSRERRLKQIGSVELLILDDFGLTPLSEEQQADLYEIICDRYERASTIITSNRDFAEWPAVFSNPLMGSAAMDRLVHRAVKLVIEGKSYRVDNFVKRSKRPSPRRQSPNEAPKKSDADHNTAQRGHGAGGMRKTSSPVALQRTFRTGVVSCIPPWTGRMSAESSVAGCPQAAARSGLECPVVAFVDNHFHWRRPKRKEATAVDEQHVMRKD